MSYCGEVGDVVEIGRGDGEISSFEWRIPDFLSLSSEGGYFYQSPPFYACDGRWCFEIHRNGFLRCLPSNWVDIFLFRLDGGPPKTLDVTLGIRGPEGVENKKERRQEFSDDDSGCFWHTICSNSELRGQNSRLMPGNGLILSLDMQSVVPSVPRGIEKVVEDMGKLLVSGNKSDISVMKKSIETLVEDMGKLLVSGHKSDISVQVKGTVFKVHSNIICARSAVLSAMLEHDTAERASNKIRIDDCEPEVFGDYLRYIYTGSVQSFSQETVFCLYRVADKYLADNLKLLCLEHIQKTLCVQTFCDAMKLALTYGENDLLQRAVDFASRNFQSIITSVEWQSFICEYPKEANEILIKCFGPRRSK